MNRTLRHGIALLGKSNSPITLREWKRSFAPHIHSWSQVYSPVLLEALHIAEKTIAKRATTYRPPSRPEILRRFTRGRRTFTLHPTKGCRGSTDFSQPVGGRRKNKGSAPLSMAAVEKLVAAMA